MLRFVAAFAVVLLLGGCAAPNALVGTWNGTWKSKSGAESVDFVYQFHPDGIVEVSEKSGKPLFESYDDIFGAHIAKKYIVKEDTLTMTTFKATWLDAKGNEPSYGPEADTDPVIDRFQITGDRMVLDTLDGSPPTTLTRQSK